MDIRLYQEKSKRTLNKDLKFTDQISNLCMGLCGESGEVIDYIKKYLFHGHNIEREKLIEELGDVMWYITNIATLYSISMDYILKQNIKKLEERYPEGFSKYESINRKEYK